MMLSAAGCGRVDAPRGRHGRQQLPHLLGHERHHRVQEPQQRVERVRQDPLRRRPATTARRAAT